MAAVYEAVDAFDDASRTRAAGISATAVRMATEMIRERGESMHTRQILKALGERGVQIGGVNPVANLSGFLSRAPELQNSRAHGWSLREWGEPPDEPLTIADDGTVAASNMHRIVVNLGAASELPAPQPELGGRSKTSPKWEPTSGGDLDDDIPF
jgi:hypothetical protein